MRSPTKTWAHSTNMWGWQTMWGWRSRHVDINNMTRCVRHVFITKQHHTVIIHNKHMHVNYKFTRRQSCGVSWIVSKCLRLRRIESCIIARSIASSQDSLSRHLTCKKEHAHLKQLQLSLSNNHWIDCQSISAAMSSRLCRCPCLLRIRPSRERSPLRFLRFLFSWHILPAR